MRHLGLIILNIFMYLVSQFTCVLNGINVLTAPAASSIHCLPTPLPPLSLPQPLDRLEEKETPRPRPHAAFHVARKRRPSLSPHLPPKPGIQATWWPPVTLLAPHKGGGFRGKLISRNPFEADDAQDPSRSPGIPLLGQWAVKCYIRIFCCRVVGSLTSPLIVQGSNCTCS